MRFEYRVPDGCGNPYLSMSAILMAAVDGMKKGMDPTESGYGPIDENVFAGGYDTSSLAMLPLSLNEALEALESDREFLEEGGVFSSEMIDDYITMKRGELELFRGSPHPREHSLYFSL
jgi:glutamine synthetase